MLKTVVLNILDSTFVDLSVEILGNSRKFHEHCIKSPQNPLEYILQNINKNMQYNSKHHLVCT